MIVAEDCTYFDQRKQCYCGARPVMRKTGKCAPHSVQPNDMGRANDWVDCYEGCLKHDITARRRWQESKRHRVERKGAAKIAIAVRQIPAEIKPVPPLDKLYVIHRQDPERRIQSLGKVLDEAISSRGVKYTVIANLINKSYDYCRSRLSHPTHDFSFMETCDIIEYLRDFDKQKREKEYVKP